MIYCRGIICFTFSLLQLVAFSQSSDTIVHIRIKPTADFDQRFYITNNQQLNVWGYRIGLLLHDKYKIGIGGYYMNDKSEVAFSFDNITSFFQTSFTQKHYIGTIYFEPYLIRKNLWESSIVTEVGYGKIKNTYTTIDEISIVKKENGYFIPAGIGLSLNLKLPAIFGVKPIRWVGINAMAGYRTSLLQNLPAYNFNGFYWSISGAVFLDRISEDYYTWKKQRKTHSF
ncbi:MAG: hypothetical protein RJA07_774 [Bacteroidota bacterium]|jgi:hypothetical protein